MMTCKDDFIQEANEILVEGYNGKLTYQEMLDQLMYLLQEYKTSKGDE